MHPIILRFIEYKFGSLILLNPNLSQLKYKAEYLYSTIKGSHYYEPFSSSEPFSIR